VDALCSITNNSSLFSSLVFPQRRSGTIASGIDSPLRQFYGTARVSLLTRICRWHRPSLQIGGRVVKRHRLCLHKLLIGSLGSLAVIRASTSAPPNSHRRRSRLRASFPSGARWPSSRHRRFFADSAYSRHRQPELAQIFAELPPHRRPPSSPEKTATPPRPRSLLSATGLIRAVATLRCLRGHNRSPRSLRADSRCSPKNLPLHRHPGDTTRPPFWDASVKASHASNLSPEPSFPDQRSSQPSCRALYKPSANRCACRTPHALVPRRRHGLVALLPESVTRHTRVFAITKFSFFFATGGHSSLLFAPALKPRTTAAARRASASAASQQTHAPICSWRRPCSASVRL
jgi:hypothetical protein